MALIKCPECGKEISDKASACIHCGCPLSDNSIIAKAGKQTAPNRKHILLIPFFVLSLTFVAVLLHLFFSSPGEQQEPNAVDDVSVGYSYEECGIFGFNEAIKWDMTKDSVTSLDIAQNIGDLGKDYVSCDNITFAELYTGDLFIRFNDEEPYQIESFEFEITDNSSADEIGKTISDVLGEPIHKDNFNNLRNSSPRLLWRYSANQYLILERSAFNGNLYVDWEVANDDIIRIANETLTNIENDAELKTAYELFLNRSKFIYGSIADAINELSLTEYQIVESSNTLFYTYDTVNYIEHTELFGLEGIFKYHCDNPYDDSPPDFVGKIEYISFEFTNEISENQAMELSKKISTLLGYQDENDKTAYLPFILNYSIESPDYIKMSLNSQYYKINPEYGYDESTDMVLASGGNDHFGPRKNSQF